MNLFFSAHAAPSIAWHIAQRFAAGLVAITLSLAPGVADAAVPRSEQDVETPVSPEVVSDAEESLGEIAVAIEEALNTAFVDEDPLDATQLDDVVVDTTVAGSESISGVGTDFQTEAAELLADPSWSETIDRVDVVLSNESEVHSNGDGTTSVTAELEITRHLVEDNTDWVELTPYELVVNNASAKVVELVPHDTDYQLAELEEEPRAEASLMRAAEQAEVPTATTVGLSASRRRAIADYALRNALRPNPAYKRYPQDCTNFVSQAMRAGGWGFVTHPGIDYRRDDAWWYGGVPTASYTWGGAENFYRMTQKLKRTSIYPNVSNLQLGDVLQYKGRGQTSMTHSMIVTSRTAKGILLSYHSSNVRNKPLAAILKKQGVTWFAHHV